MLSQPNEWPLKNRKRLPKVEECYSYPHHEVYLVDGEFRQTRSGPNWQGGIATLSTCKHHLRTTNRDWHGVWMAGFTPMVCGGNFLLYVGRVQGVYCSMLGLWQALRATPAGEAHNARTDPLGDVYEPAPDHGDPYSVASYQLPHPQHVRRVEYYKDGTPKWHRDIHYANRQGRVPRLFILEPFYLYTRPMFQSAVKLGRATRKQFNVEAV